MIGLVIFLVGHIYFLVAFLRRMQGLQQLQKVNTYLQSGYTLFSLVVIANYILPHVHDNVLKAGIMIYCAVIGRMTATSMGLSLQESNLR